MHLVIAKIDQTLFDGEAYSLTAPGSAGEMTMLGHHEPLITTLKAGDLRVHVAAGDEPKLFAITGGVLEIRPEGA
ncbi:MAG TPA: F0F1 ATP synthase subunit epsilon, partial [Candidatus Paceibacterota bacterium]|nr:F0F1 ATP synthase subunit epsilon [Candidatus Paceibacterota bacterium]